MNPWWSFLLGLIAAGVPAGAAAWHFRKKSEESDKARQKEEKRRFAAEETLLGTPDGLYRWNTKNDVETCDARLAVLLGLEKGPAARYSDILSRFESDISQQLDRAVAALKRDGRPFDLLLPLKDGSRTVQAVGVRSLTEDGSELAHCLWMRDVSDSRTIGAPEETADPVAAATAILRGIAESFPHPLWFRDSALNITYANPNAPREDVSRHLANKSVAGDIAISELTTFKIGGLPQRMEVTEIPLPDGTGTLGFAVDAFQPEPENTLAAPLSTGLDEAEEAAVLDNLTTAVAIYDRRQRLTYYNKAYTDLWGMGPDWAGGGPSYSDVLEQLREARLLPEVADFRSFKEEELKRFEDQDEREEALLHLPNNTSLRAVISPHKDGGLIFTYEDVTDRLELESSYKTLLAVQRETLDNLYEGVAVFGPDGRLQLTNPAFLNIWLLKDGDLGEQPHLADFVEKTRPFYMGYEDWDLFKDSLITWLMNREPKSGRLDRSDGSVLDYAAVPLPDGAVLLSYLDVSDSALVEKALRERAEAMQAADKLKSEFIANLSYEVRTPLNSIVGFADILVDQYFGKLNKRQGEYAQGIQDSAQTLLTLFSDIMDLANIEAGQLSLELDTVDVHALLAGVLGLVKERSRKQKLDLDFDCPADIGWVVADEKRLKQVLFQLLSNATKGGGAGSKVALTAKRVEEMVAISVSDSGSRLARSDQADLFEKTTREDNTDAAAGMGLTLVRRFIELHGGRVSIETKPGQGTTVTCYLPGG